MIIVGCPVKNDLDSLKVMVKSLVNSTNAYDHIIFVIGEGTNNETLEFLNNVEWLNDRVHILNAQCKTPLEAYNILFNAARDFKADLLLTQTDVVFPILYKRDWLQQMKEISKIQDVGGVMPINGGGVSGPDYIDGFQWMGGWCSYYPYKIIEKIGGYDSKFSNGFGVDIDHTYRIYNNGFKVVKMNYWVDHHQMNSREHDADPKAEEMKKEASIYFKKKWGII